MKEFFDSVILYHDCSLEVLKTLESNSVDSIVTDPPYELGFMGRSWDKTGIANNVELWKDLFRVLKPGGHVLSFGGSRTYHRMVCAIEDVGFEIRDQIMYIYGTGFPKSLDISKAIDKKLGETKIWKGWGTGLKPAHEPICLARKPLIGTVAENVLEYGTGGLNIDGCRVEINLDVDDSRLGGKGTWSSNKMAKNVYEGGYAGNRVGSSNLGRFPANLIHDGSDEVISYFPNAQGQQGISSQSGEEQNNSIYGKMKHGGPVHIPRKENNKNSARFFYSAKASKKDRGESNIHPTVKPTELMRYLCRLITPPNGIVLDPFMGSGSTGKAALLEKFKFIGIEKEKDYFDIASRRIKEISEDLYENDNNGLMGIVE